MGSSYQNHRNVFPTLWELLPPLYSLWGKLVLSAGSQPIKQYSSQQWVMFYESCVDWATLMRKWKKNQILSWSWPWWLLPSGQSSVPICQVPEGPTTGDKAKLPSFPLLYCLERYIYLQRGHGTAFQIDRRGLAELHLECYASVRRPAACGWEDLLSRAHIKALKVLNSC